MFLSIFHIVIVIAHYWLAGNAHILAEDNFEITDMVDVT